MLGRQGILAPAISETLDSGLASLAKAAREGSLVPDLGAEDVHSFVEGELTEMLGDPGRALHAGRSRNDQVALDLRLWLRGASRDARRELVGCIEALCDLAGRNTSTVMPGYTHMQRAQPVTFAHHLLAWCAALERDHSRFADADARANECPLGSCALSGTGLPIDREGVAADLGFARPSRNTMDAVSDRDACVEFAAASATTLMHLSRFCEEIVLWATAEFAFVAVGPSCSTGSSVMPQKRNPDPAELIRGKAGRSFGALLNLLVIQKGLPLSYDRDLQEDKSAIFDSADTVIACLRAFRILVGSLAPRPDRMRAAAEDGCLWAADAAEFLVLRGTPFRTAYAAGRALVEAWIAGRETGRGPGVKDLLDSLGPKGLAALHPSWAGVPPTELSDYLALDACISRRSLVGGPSPLRTSEEISRFRAFTVASNPGR
jgi:argininosuccinate lyase